MDEIDIEKVQEMVEICQKGQMDSNGKYNKLMVNQYSPHDLTEIEKKPL